MCPCAHLLFLVWCSFLAGVLVSKDVAVLSIALQIAEGLMAKLPDVFRRQFVKEGVVHALDTLVAAEPSLAPAGQPDAAGPSTPDEGGAGPSSGPFARPKRASAKQRRKEDEGEGAAGPGSGKEGTVAIARAAAGGADGEPAGTSSAVRTLGHSGTGRAGSRLVAAARARRLKEMYFREGDAENGDAARMSKLKELCAQICGGGRKKGEKHAKKGGKYKSKKEKERGGAGDGQDADTAALKEVLALLLDGDGVSTFEFVGSGVAPALLKLLTEGATTGEKKGEHANADLAQQRAQTLARLQHFVDLVLPASAASSDEAPLTVLVRKLQAALTSLERFPVMLSQAPAASRSVGARSGGGVAMGLSALTQPFKLRLSRAPGETALRDYSSNVVLIEPLATLMAVEDFLWHRVRVRPDGLGSSNGASTSGAAAAAEAQLDAALAAAAAQFAVANGRAGKRERAQETRAAAASADAAAGADGRPLTRAQKREAAAAAAAQSRKDAGTKEGAQKKGTAVEPRVTRSAARRRAETGGQGGQQEEQKQKEDERDMEQHEHDVDSEVSGITKFYGAYEKAVHKMCVVSLSTLCRLRCLLKPEANLLPFSMSACFSFQWENVRSNEGGLLSKCKQTV
jgi:E3 ubiquitin-protein ligase TRIP12